MCRNIMWLSFLWLGPCDHMVHKLSITPPQKGQFSIGCYSTIKVRQECCVQQHLSMMVLVWSQHGHPNPEAGMLSRWFVSLDLMKCLNACPFCNISIVYRPFAATLSFLCHQLKHQSFITSKSTRLISIRHYWIFEVRPCAYYVRGHRLLFLSIARYNCTLTPFNF